MKSWEVFVPRAAPLPKTLALARTAGASSKTRPTTHVAVMLLPKMRPEFRRELDLPLRGVSQAVSTALANTPNRVVGKVAETVIELYPTRVERHLFSPHLSVVLYPRNQTLVVGRYGPNPDVWTFFVALYALCFFSAFGGSLGAVSQWAAGLPPTAWIGIPVGAVGAVMVYSAALIGRHAARHQVALLANFFERCIDEAQQAIADSPPTPGQP